MRWREKGGGDEERKEGEEGRRWLNIVLENRVSIRI